MPYSQTQPTVALRKVTLPAPPLSKPAEARLGTGTQDDPPSEVLSRSDREGKIHAVVGVRTPRLRCPMVKGATYPDTGSASGVSVRGDGVLTPEAAARSFQLTPPSSER
jgi:hypothetical protein